MALDLDIRTAIEKNLSIEVGNVLKQRLEQAERDALAVSTLTTQRNQLQERVSELNHLYEQKKGLEVALQNFQIKEAALAMKEAVLAEREKHIVQSKQDMHNILMQVFKGPAVDAAYNLNLNGYTGGGSMNLNGGLLTKREG